MCICFLPSPITDSLSPTQSYSSIQPHLPSFSLYLLLPYIFRSHLDFWNESNNPNPQFIIIFILEWSQQENKRFEEALALFDKETPDRWHNVARMIPGKSVTDVINQYRKLEEDISDILNLNDELKYYSTSHGGKKKGIPWSEEEHRQFLLGLKKYGKGDWRNISRNFVTTRTPTQVASHAQKYFIRQLSGGKDKIRRSSIHDITTVNLDHTTKTNHLLAEPTHHQMPLGKGTSTTVEAEHAINY